jgi:hypothetical protein
MVYYLFDKDFLKALWTDKSGSTEEKLGMIYGMTLYVGGLISLRPYEELNDQVNLLAIYFIYYFILDYGIESVIYLSY